jgi:hypothetical protein
MAISFTLNGKPTTLDDPDMPLLWAIREVVGLHGTKFGCGVAQCAGFEDGIFNEADALRQGQKFRSERLEYLVNVSFEIGFNVGKGHFKRLWHPGKFPAV